jgi:hypothetical protein
LASFFGLTGTAFGTSFFGFKKAGSFGFNP